MTESATPDAPRELSQILARGLDWMRSLKAALIEERDALERRDAERLAAAVRSKEQMARKLTIVDRHRTEIEALGKAGGESGTDLPGLVREFRAIARDCERINLTNGTIIRARQRQISDGLAVLSGRDRDEETYTPAGSRAAPGTRRVLTEA